VQKLIFAVSTALICAALGAGPAQAADPGKVPLTPEEIATYTGPDRQERLIEGAKKEGELTVYHAYPQLSAVTAAFSKKYGIKVRTWRGGSEALLQRIVGEARAKKYDVDIVQNNAPETEALHREKLLQEVRSPYLASLLPAASPPHKEWVGITLDVYSAAYNTSKISKEELPKSYRDLLDPRWKGRLSVEAEDQGWFNTLLDALGEQQGLKLFDDIVAKNGLTVRKGHSLLTSLVASGEVPLALSVYSWNPEQIKAKGAPVQGFLIEPVIAQFSTMAMLKKAPHPHAAALFYDFALNEGQQILADMHFVPTSQKLPSPVANVQIRFVDPGRALDMQDKWIKTYNNVVMANTAK
jgi:iron(III) transport system substrate-binding protein